MSEVQKPHKGLLSEDHSEIALIEAASRDVWLQERRSRPRVRVGQIWQSCDKRETRSVEVLAVDGVYATVRSPSGVGRKSRIRIDRMRPNSTGYRLVFDPERER